MFYTGFKQVLSRVQAGFEKAPSIIQNNFKQVSSTLLTKENHLLELLPAEKPIPISVPDVECHQQPVHILLHLPGVGWGWTAAHPRQADSWLRGDRTKSNTKG
jgi:hypothetical protein